MCGEECFDKNCTSKKIKWKGKQKATKCYIGP